MIDNVIVIPEWELLYMLHYHITVIGYVQGVGFRYYIRKIASLHGINGWVRNMPDGTVEIDAEGGEANMAEFVKAVEKGSRYSSVEKVNVEKLAETENYKSFEIV